MPGPATFSTISSIEIVNTGKITVGEHVVTGTANVNNLNVTGTANVNNLNVTGTLASINGDLHVNGNVTATGYIGYPYPVDIKNLTARTAMDPSQIYTYEATMANVQTQYFTKPIIGTASIKLRDENGPTSLMTSATPHNNPIATAAFGQVAPLVKIQDNGSYTYIDVASTSISDICETMLPTTATANTFVMQLAVNNPTVDLSLGVTTVEGKTVATYSDMLDAYTNIATALHKRGFPITPPNGCKTYNVNNIYFQTTNTTGDIIGSSTMPSEYAFAPVKPIEVAIDVNPWLDGEGTMNLYFCGGFQLLLPIALPGITFYEPNIPAFPIAVTTNAAEYQNKVAAGVNSVYLNEALNILNINIVNFGGGYSTSMRESPFSSNLVTSNPLSFTGSFGFFRTSNKTTTTVGGSGIVDSNTSMTVVSGSTPVMATPSSADYMIQVDSNIVFTYSVSNATVTNTYTTTIQNSYGGLTDYWTLEKYDNGSGINSKQYMFGADENMGFTLTNTSNTGLNDFYPWVNTRKAKSSMAFADHLPGYGMYSYQNFNKDAEFAKSIPPAVLYTDNQIMPILLHELGHGIVFGTGVDGRDGITSLWDDELWVSTLLAMEADNFTQHSSTAHFYNMPWQAINAHLLARGGAGITNNIVYDHLADAFRGTNFNVQSMHNQLIFAPYSKTSAITQVFFNKYPMCNPFGNIIKKYDPNAQLLKLMLFNQSAVESKIPVPVIQSILEQRNKPFYERLTVNPAFGNMSYRDAVSNAHMYYSTSDGGALVTNPGELWENEVITSILVRRNAAIPDKYKWLVSPAWGSSGYCSNVINNVPNTTTSGFYGLAYNMHAWDYMQTNDDPIGANMRYERECVVPWWPKNITGLYTGNVNSVGRLYVNPITFEQQAQTQDTSYRAMANVSLSTYTSNVVRNLSQGSCFMYALPYNLSNVSVDLNEPSIGTYTGGYNTDVTVSVFKYIPDRCVSNVLIGSPTSNTGAFMMAGPYSLSKTGTTSVTIDLTAPITNGVGGKVFRTNSTNLLNGTIAFSSVFQYGIDDGTAYTPPAHATAFATSLGMIKGVYQPVTYLLVNNRNIDTINWTDADIQDKLWSYQVKPSCVKVRVNGTS
jgi:hypothetical protein